VARVEPDYSALDEAAKRAPASADPF